MIRRNLVWVMFLTFLAFSQAFLAQKVKPLNGVGVVLYERIGGTDKVERYKLEVSAFDDYIVLLTGLGRGDLDVKVYNPFGEVIGSGTTDDDTEAFTFTTGAYDHVFLEVEVYSGYSESAYFVLIVVGHVRTEDVSKIYTEVILTKPTFSFSLVKKTNSFRGIRNR